MRERLQDIKRFLGELAVDVLSSLICIAPGSWLMLPRRGTAASV
jgi:hypothetical protein